ncbi:MAG: NupC/NupG family nucleoside CNT transporter [Candidatus Hydrogenedens sp.]|nr:NupC/NupG family nucleoside CNT transporter [Candidatus Hydrogenedens sp.]
MRLISAGGLFCMIACAWALSEDRRRIPWRLLLWGLGLQALLGLFVLQTVAGAWLFSGMRRIFDLLSDASTEGAQFVFGNLSRFFMLERVYLPGAEGEMVAQDSFAINAIFAFNVLPVIIFVAGMAAILQHLGVIQVVVRAFSRVMRRSLKTSGAETFATALLVFTGIESVSAVRVYLERMTRSELFTVMVAFLSTIAASVMVAYANFGAEPGHLLAASLMSAPAAILISKFMIPEKDTPETLSEKSVSIPVDSENVFDAAVGGASLGLNMALNVAAMLIVFVGLIYLLDRASLALTSASATQWLGYFFYPFALVMGIPLEDLSSFSQLLATKTIFNEFIAYQQLQTHIADGTLNSRSVMIATYALCGFANPGSLGILIGGISAVAPKRRAEVAQLGLRALAGGTLACFMTACIAGIFG